MLTPQQQATQQRDRELTDYLYSSLRELPNTIYQLESDAAVLVNTKREAAANLDDAELTIKIGVQFAEKMTVDAQKRLIEAAVAKDETVKKYKKEVMQAENEIEMNEAEAKSKRREFQAAIALTELHAARINLMSKIQNVKDATK
jgi:hypothetical protein